MEKRQSYENLTKQVRIDAGLHKLLKVKASSESMTIKELVEGVLAELLAIKSN